jgi:hypothetical protein
MENIDKENIIKRKIPNTKFWVKGIKKSDKTWDLYMDETETDNEELIRENMTTESLQIFLNTTLKIEPEKNPQDHKSTEESKNVIPEFNFASKIWWVIIIVIIIISIYKIGNRPNRELTPSEKRDNISTCHQYYGNGQEYQDCVNGNYSKD